MGRAERSHMKPPGPGGRTNGESRSWEEGERPKMEELLQLTEI